MSLFQTVVLKFANAVGYAVRYVEGAALAPLCRAAALLVIMTAATPAFGQGTRPDGDKQQTGSVHGTISTKQESASSDLTGISVKLATVPPDGNPLTAATDDAGRYEFKNLKPGPYTVSITQAGFKSVTKQVSVATGQAAVQDITLELETVSEKVEVKEQNQVISTESVSNPDATVTHTEMIALPTQQEKIRELLPITPGVIRTMDGKLSFKGADENQSLFLVNSAQLADPVTGSFSIPVPTDVVQSFAVYKTPYDASLGSFSGGLTTIDTKSPADGFDFNLTKLGLTVLGKNGHLAGLGGADPSILFDVPLIAHKLLLSEAFEYEMKKTTVEGLPWPNDISKRQGFNSYSTLEAILSANHLLTLTVNAFPLRTDHIDISALIPQPASNSLNQNGVAIALSDHYEFASHASLSTVGQYTRFDSNAHGYGPEDMLITPQGYDENYFNTWSRRGKEFQFLSTYEFSKKEWHGSHEIRVGVDIDWRSFFGTTESHPIQILRGDNSLAETVNFSSVPAQTPSDSIFAEFVQDHWLLNSHMSADLGFRLSTETTGRPAGAAPRVGLAYAPGKDEKTVIRAGAGLFYGVLPLLAADWGANPARTITQFNTSGLPIGPPITYTNVYTAGLNPLTSPGL